MPFKKASLVFHHLPMRNNRALCTYRYTACKADKRDRNAVDTFKEYKDTPFATLRWSRLNQLRTSDLSGSGSQRVCLIFLQKLSPRYFYCAFLSHSLYKDIVQRALDRGFAVAGDERPEGFAWAFRWCPYRMARFTPPTCSRFFRREGCISIRYERLCRFSSTGDKRCNLFYV
jgi:hypothetical protein